MTKVSPSTSDGSQAATAKKQKVNFQQQSIANFVKIEKHSLSADLAELVAKDGIAINQISNSNVLARLMRKSDLELPKSQTTIAKLVHEEAERIREEVSQAIVKMKEKEKHKKFSISVDEATTRSRYRILNIELYCGLENFNLGMILVPKTCPSDTMVELTDERLKRFKVDRKDLLLIKPTSIRNEENFSGSNNFLSDKRTRMSCQTLDDYCFLKSHYIKKDKK